MATPRPVDDWNDAELVSFDKAAYLNNTEWGKWPDFNTPWDIIESRDQEENTVSSSEAISVSFEDGKIDKNGKSSESREVSHVLTSECKNLQDASAAESRRPARRRNLPDLSYGER